MNIQYEVIIHMYKVLYLKQKMKFNIIHKSYLVAMLKTYHCL
jgi:hypothetical protein